ncbi:MAG: M48 family metallopeptidase [Proteobacteria bacterium]|nr:M48 family metallopeptidase [Pseudomonadota bacterium]
MAKRISILGAMPFMVIAFLAPQVAPAAGIRLIRDAEIEHSIRVWATPIFDSAGLIAEDVRIYLVNDRRINAFVAGGQNLFLNTGLLMKSQNPGQVIAVIAHEAGHIAGGHSVRRQEAQRNAMAEALIRTLLGAAVGIAAGRADVGMAGIGAGQTYAQRKFLAYSRTQESAADQAALRYLDASGISSRGLIEFLEIIGSEERRVTVANTPYLRTHPLNKARMQTVRAHVAASPYTDNVLPAEFEIQHRRMRGKLIGFLETPDRVFGNYYRATDTSLEARYARAIAYYRKADLVQALRGIDALIAEQPEDPFYHELRGQMLYENGRAREALPSYERAVRLFPDSGLLRIELAQALIDLDERAADRVAIAHLNEGLRQEYKSVHAWRLLAVAHGRAGNIGMTSLALAERAMVQGKKDEAMAQAERAERLLPMGAPGWLRAQDIQFAAKKRDR